MFESKMIVRRIITVLLCFIIMISCFDFTSIVIKADDIKEVDTDTDYLSFGTIDQYNRVYYQTVNVFNLNDSAVDLMWYTSDPNGILYVDAPDSMHLESYADTQFYVKCDSSLPAGRYSAELYICDRNDSSCIKGSCVRVSVTINEAKPYISSVSVAPKNISLTTNSKATFSANVSGGNNYSNDVEWSVIGSNGKSTIDNSGNLTIADGESASKLTVRATSKTDRNYYDEASVTITKNSYAISVSADPSNAGAVTGAGTFNQGDSTSLVASPYSGYQFVRWKENGKEISRSSKVTISNISYSANYQAEFKQINCKVHVTSNHSYGGNVSGDVTVAYGGEATITATANPGYRFDGWYENNTKLTDNTKYKLTNVTSDRTITAVFNPNEYSVATQVSPGDGGTVTGAGKYAQGATVQLEAKANNGYTFSGWFLNGNEYSKNAKISISNIKSDYNFVAYFMRKGTTTYNITSSAASNDGTISPDGNFLLPEGNNALYVITPKAGFEIADVKVDDVSVGAVTSYTFTNVKSQHKIVAYFKKKEEVNNTTQNHAEEKLPSNMPETSEVIVKKEPANTKADNGVDYIRPVSDYNLDDEVGLMQEYNISDYDAINMIRNGAGKEMFEKAIREGTFELSVYNELGNFMGQVQQLGDADVSIVNVEAAIGGMLSDEDLLSILHSKKLAISINLFDSSDNVSEKEKSFINSSLFGGMRINKYFDIVILKSVDGATTEITNLSTPMTLVINVPTEFRNANRSLYIVRSHTDEDGITTTDILTDEDMNPDTITFTSDKFSTYALVYIDSYSSAADKMQAGVNYQEKNPNDKRSGIMVFVISVVGLIIALAVANIIVAKARRKRK